jgi:hypothetical protein
VTHDPARGDFFVGRVRFGAHHGRGDRCPCKEAYAGLSDTAQRNALATAIGGRGGIGVGRLLQDIAGVGGVNAELERARARTTQREERDGRGNRRLQVVIEEMVAAAAGRPGSPVQGALLGGQGR